jgi:hypothetical protein
MLVTLAPKDFDKLFKKNVNDNIDMTKHNNRWTQDKKEYAV